MLAALLLSGYDRAALGVFAFAGLSDAADGFLAKRLGFSTHFGRYLDPAADKLLMLAAFLSLATIHASPVWLTVLVILRDGAIVSAIGLAHVIGLPLRVEPLPIGKASTAAQVGFVALLLIARAAGIEIPAVVRIAVMITAAFTVTSGIAYAILWLKAFATRYRRAT